MTMKNMKKVSAKIFFTVRGWLVLAMLLTVFPISAQNSASQTDLKEFERVDICTRNPKYAIVTKDGKKGIYDMLLHQNVVPAQFREVFFSRQDVEDSLYYSIYRKMRFPCSIAMVIIRVYYWLQKNNLYSAKKSSPQRKGGEWEDLY